MKCLDSDFRLRNRGRKRRSGLRAWTYEISGRVAGLQVKILVMRVQSFLCDAIYLRSRSFDTPCSLVELKRAVNRTVIHRGAQYRVDRHNVYTPVFHMRGVRG